MNFSQDLQDRAREWVNTNYPEADGEEWDMHFDLACKDLQELDDQLDEGGF